MLRDLGYTALLLGVLIFVHELGHFLVAKLLRVKVVRFSMGFGPKLFSFTRGETEYQLAAIPLGGYVKMAGDMPGEELGPEEAHRGFLAQSPWRRMLIVAAGPAFSLAFPVLVYFFVFLGAHDALSNRIGSVVAGLPAAQAELRPGDRILAIDGVPIRTFPEISLALKTRYGQDVTLTVDRDGRTFTTHLRPALDVGDVASGAPPRGMIGIAAAPLPPVLGVPETSAAYAAGLRTFDRVLQLNGVPVKTEHDFFRAVEAVTPGTRVRLQVLRSNPLLLPAGQLLVPEILTLEVPREEGRGYAALGVEDSGLYVGSVLPETAAARAGLQRGDRLLALDGKALASWMVLDLALGARKEAPFVLSWRSGSQEHTQTLSQALVGLRDEVGTRQQALDFGVRPWTTRFEERTAERVTLHRGPIEALDESVRIVPELIGMTAVGIASMVTGKVSLDNMGSVIMMHDLASKKAQEGMDAFLQLMAVISINLGLINLLPIPILDGFHILAAGWEAVRRRPIPVRAREIANMVGLAVLLFLMGIAIKNDIVRMLF